MRHGSLFSGIGGFDLASEWMGWENVFHCEWNEFGQKVLNYYWPKAISYHDITKTDFSVHRGTIDIITGGFPCQPYSMAGKRKGKEDERHLWPEMLRAIREIQPTWVVGENVLGLVNWDGGLVFHEVQADLEAQGYEVQPYVLPAASVNAPHRRDRVWFIAYSKSCADSRKSRKLSNEAKEENGGWIEPGTSSEQQVQLPTESSSLFGSIKNSNKDGWGSEFGQKESSEWKQRNSCSRDNEWIPTNNEKVRNASNSSSLGFCKYSSGEQLFSETFGTQFGMDKENSTNSISKGLQGCTNTREIRSKKGNTERERDKFAVKSTSVYKQSNATDSDGFGLRGQSDRIGNSRFINKKSKGNNWQNFPTVSPICDGDDGISDRLDSITFSKWRNESIKAGGNAIVPQVVYQIFKAIEQYNQLDKQLSI
jgi:DNA (cytosine-5)-methyltransferase 1